MDDAKAPVPQEAPENHDAASTIRKKKAFLEAFEKFNGMVNAACQSANVGVSTYYLWRQKDAVFRAEADRVLSEQQVYVEDKLIQAIHSSQPWAIAFYLSHKHPSYMLGRLQRGGGLPAGDARTLEDILDDDEKEIPPKGEDKPPIEGEIVASPPPTDPPAEPPKP